MLDTLREPRNAKQSRVARKVYQTMIIKCRCCNQDVKIDLQERPAIVVKGVVKREALSPMLMITCRNTACKLHDVTFTVTEILHYETRDIEGEGKYDINR